MPIDVSGIGQDGSSKRQFVERSNCDEMAQQRNLGTCPCNDNCNIVQTEAAYNKGAGIHTAKYNNSR